ncbi:MAG: PIG-L family deacetylase [Candidatus Cloacimonetes bacterium]|nr:PIG-L family deacetylase [Candidatus Cloacimonadota bacterium]
MKKIVFAIASHPDDIEFMMAGTLFRLREADYEVHYMNVANGCCGTDRHGIDEIIEIRREESKQACEYMGATFHDSLVNDLEIFYEKKLISQIASIIRQVSPDIILTQYPFEYMEDHSNTARTVVTAAFCRGMKNFPVQPDVKPITKTVAIYHSLPYGLTDSLRKPVEADFYVDVEAFIENKAKMLAKHKSQKEWLDISQGLDAYLITMKDMCAEIGKMSGKFKFAEGWIRHSHYGFCGKEDNSLADMLKNT